MTNKGYTLIEILVAISVFGIIIAGPTGLFVLSLRNQNMSLALGETIDNTSHAVEYMGRALRMARKDTTGSCITSGYNYMNPGGDTSKVRFLSYNGYCQEFYISNGQIVQEKSSDGNSSGLDGTNVYLTSDDLEITNAKFLLDGESQGDDKQPKVTIVFRIAKSDTLPGINVQTSMSQRNLDVAY
jgi:prepilin-type N-terminal cleavage/methylation domain-containing protein